MRSVPEFLLVALVVTLTPGPATAMVIRMSARDGRAAALRTVVGNSCGVLIWAALSALGVSSLVLASEVAFDVLRVVGAAVLVVIGLRSLFAHRAGRPEPRRVPRRPAGWRLGLLTSLANPKLAVFFVALFPQFLSPHAAVLPAALAMGAIIVAFDLVWFTALSWLVDRARVLLRPRLQRVMERITGTVLVGLGVGLVAEGR